jgi:hypothetical protein
MAGKKSEAWKGKERKGKERKGKERRQARYELRTKNLPFSDCKIP